MEPFLGQLQCFAFNFTPRGWAFCNGQMMLVNQNQALYSLLGTTFGGGGGRFALPDLRGRLMHGVMPRYAEFELGANGGVENVTLGANDLREHTHAVVVSSKTSVGTVAQENYFGAAPIYVQEDPDTLLNPTMVLGNAQADSSFSVVQPVQAINWFIAIEGTFPSRD